MIAEYFLGFLVAIVMLIVFRLLGPRIIRADQVTKIKYSQSHIHDIIRYNLPDEVFLPIKKSRQSYSHEKKTSLKVVFLDKEAYWIKENKLFVADHEAGIVKEGTARGVDTMGMNKVQLEKVIYIVDILNEGTEDDRGYTGNKGF
jgi:uncharacterized membrane-anchored protein YitT (DUF2179 family)